MSDKSLYDILGVRADASQAEIRAAYLKLAKQWHPDRNAGNEIEAERRFKEIAHAYDVLSDSQSRAAYDEARTEAAYDTTGFESSMDDDAAFDLFISVLLDLAFELAASGADQIAIYQALIDMGCPSGTAKTLAQRAHKHGGAEKAASSDAAEKSKSHQGDKFFNDDSAPQSEILQVPEISDYGAWQWIAALVFMAIPLAISFGFAISGDRSGPEAEATEAAFEATESVDELNENSKDITDPSTEYVSAEDLAKQYADKMRTLIPLVQKDFTLFEVTNSQGSLWYKHNITIADRKSVV